MKHSYVRARTVTKLPMLLHPLRTLESVAMEMGITKSAVWQLERQALYKIFKRMRPLL